MGKKFSGQCAKQIVKELDSLYKTTFTWKLAYKTNKEIETVKNLQVLSVFNYESLNERTDISNKSERLCELQLNEKIRDNLKELVTIPVNWGVRKQIKTQIAKIQYSRLDNIFATTDIYSRTGKNTVIDLLLTPSRYKYKSHRKQVLEKLYLNLNGKRLSSLKIIQVTIGETVDGQDCKITYRAVDDLKIAKHQSVLPIVNKDKNIIEYLANHMGENVGMAKENKGLYIMLAKHYSENLIFRAVGEFKELVSQDPQKYENKPAYFTSIIHTTAHKMGKEWIKPCDKNCQYRNP